MASPNGQKGTAWETACERFLAPLGAERKPRRGARDISDLHARGWALECKNEARAQWAAYVDEANAEAANAGLPYGAAVVKRRRGPGSPGTVETGYVVMDLETFRRQELERMEQARLLEWYRGYREVMEGLPPGTLPRELPQAGPPEVPGIDQTRQEARQVFDEILEELDGQGTQG